MLDLIAISPWYLPPLSLHAIVSYRVEQCVIVKVLWHIMGLQFQGIQCNDV